MTKLAANQMWNFYVWNSVFAPKTHQSIHSDEYIEMKAERFEWDIYKLYTS